MHRKFLSFEDAQRSVCITDVDYKEHELSDISRTGEDNAEEEYYQVQRTEVNSDGRNTLSFMMRSIVLALILLIPDRLPSLIVLVGFWFPAAVAGWVAAEILQQSTRRYRAAVTYAGLATFVLGYAAAWLFFNLSAIPPYLPGATQDPTFAPPEAVRGLLVLTGALVLPGSAIASVLAFRIARRLRGNPSVRVSA